MKKTQIAAMLMIAAAATVSCNKENAEVQNPGNQAYPVTICATANALGNPTKAELKYRFDVVWNADDEIAVKDASGAVSTFGLTDGAGTVKGTFSKKSGSAPTGAAEAFYPSALVNGASLAWPAVQDNETTVPMYAAVDALAEGENAVDFNSLGAMFRIMFTTDVEDIAVESVTLTALGANDVLSGAFTVSDGKAVMASGGSNSVKVEFAEPVAVSGKHGVFNISIPAGTYADGFEMVFKATDGTTCTMTSTKAFEIAQNTVNVLIINGKAFRHTKPADAINGLYTIDAAGHQVYFAKGNLKYDAASAKWGFLDTQYEYQSSVNSNVVTLFTWGYGDWSTDSATNTYAATQADFVDWGTAVDNQGTWRTLSRTEWEYVLWLRGDNTKVLRTCVNVCGAKDCIVTAPDGNEVEIKESYTEEEWAVAEAAGFVCLPNAGYRASATSIDFSYGGYYWSSTQSAGNAAYTVNFNGSNWKTAAPLGKQWASPVRLVSNF